MGKKKGQQKTVKDVHTFPINKNKTLRANLDAYIRLLKSKHSHLPTKEYLALVHNYVARYSKIAKGISQSMVVQTTNKIKICRQCNKWALGSQKMVQCNLCDDSFHQLCAGELKNNRQQWICVKCESVDEIARERKKREQEQLKKTSKCLKCSQRIKEKDLEILCMRCDKKYHKKCFGSGIVVCQKCEVQIQNKLMKTPPKQLDIRQSFKIASQSSKTKRRMSSKSRKQYAKKVEDSEESTDRKAQIPKEENIPQSSETLPFGFKKDKLSGESTNFTCLSNLKKFTAQFPEMTEKEISHYKSNLVYAILAKKMEYTQKLQPQNCSLFEDFEESLDFAVEHLSQSDLKMFDKYKKQPIGPFLLRFTQSMGYDVVADKDIPKGMIVCQYVGDVYPNRVVLELNAKEPNDSIMELKYGTNADESLSIMPIKYTNIARFINGTKAGMEEKANVQSRRAFALGRPVVILYTIKTIKKGQSLLYDYNAGQSSRGIDTSQFV